MAEMNCSQFWRSKVGNQGASMVRWDLFSRLQTVDFWLCPYMVKGVRELWGRGKGISFERAHIPFMKAPSTLIGLSTSQRPQLQIPLTLGVRISTCECWGDIDIQTRADSLNTLPDPRRWYEYHSVFCEGDGNTEMTCLSRPAGESWRVDPNPGNMPSDLLLLAATLDVFLINTQPSALGMNLILRLRKRALNDWYKD